MHKTQASVFSISRDFCKTLLFWLANVIFLTFLRRYSTISIMEQSIEKLISDNAEKFEKYYNMLVEWNQKFNLTAITDREGVFVKHFADSLLGERYVPQNATVLDVGTGAGFPSLPVKIARPDVRLTLNDSLQKRIGFLNEVVAALGLQDVQTIHARAEDLKERDYYDVVLSRAVAPLNILAEYCLPFVRVGGKFVAYKAEDCAEEVTAAENAIKTLGGKLLSVDKIRLDENTVRAFVVVEKTRKTDKKYPRGKNLPRKAPL